MILHLSATGGLIMLTYLVDRRWILNEKEIKSIVVFWLGDYLTTDINNECTYTPNTNFCDVIMLQDNHMMCSVPMEVDLMQVESYVYVYVIYIYSLSLNAVGSR